MPWGPGSPLWGAENPENPFGDRPLQLPTTTRIDRLPAARPEVDEAGTVPTDPEIRWGMLRGSAGEGGVPRLCCGCTAVVHTV